MTRFKKWLLSLLSALAMALSLMVAAPVSASASGNPQVCLTSSSYRYAYLTIRNYQGDTLEYVNRGKCSRWGNYIDTWSPVKGTYCSGRGQRYWGGVRYRIGNIIDFGSMTVVCNRDYA